jgi:hypothetical protein
MWQEYFCNHVRDVCERQLYPFERMLFGGRAATFLNRFGEQRVVILAENAVSQLERRSTSAWERGSDRGDQYPCIAAAHPAAVEIGVDAAHVSLCVSSEVRQDRDTDRMYMYTLTSLWEALK